jgi:hypothetical protein
VSVLINAMALLGLACSILGVLLAAWFFIPAIPARGAGISPQWQHLPDHLA